MYKKIAVVALSLCVTSCISTQKYNAKLESPLPVAKLQEDIDYTQQKLERYYPNLYGYISKEKLEAKFDSIRRVVNQPMTSKAFYLTISPVIASVRQGHMNMMPASKRLPKSELKRLKKMGEGPLSQFVFEWQNDKLYVIRNKSKNKGIKPGAEVVSINALTPQEVYAKYRPSITSDGYNQTYIRKGFTKRFSSYLIQEIGVNDSLTYVFKQHDSLLTTVISRKVKETPKAKIKGGKTTTDSLSSVAPKVEQPKKPTIFTKKNKRILGFDEASGEFVKSLKVAKSDSTVAVLKIKDFSRGNFRKAYAQLFDSVKKMNCTSLVIDIRDNPGGRIADVTDLYGYLTDSDYTLLQPALVTSKTSLWKPGIFRSAPKIAYPFIAVGYPFYMAFSYFKTTKNSDGNYQYKLTGSRAKKAKLNHFEGKIYVLINGGSFSASCILSSSLKTNPKVTFVGEETGGAFNGTVAGLMPVVVLPNSEIPLRLGLMDIKTVSQTAEEGRGIFPDIEIIQTISDKTQGIDPEMNWVLSDVKKSRQN